MRRHLDWLRQSEKDLVKAGRDLKEGDYEWACFTAQQAAEKSVKAALEYAGLDVRGHAVSELLREIDADALLLDKAKVLDHHYIPSRYVNAYPSGAPMDFYTKRMAEEALTIAEEIILFCKAKIK